MPENIDRRAEAREFKRKADEIVKLAEKEERDLTDDEEKSCEEYIEKAERKMRQAKMIERGDPINKDLSERSLPNVTETRELFLDDPMRGFKHSREMFSSLIECARGKKTDKRLASLSVRESGELRAAGSDEAGIYSDPHGGFLIPDGLIPGLLDTRSPDTGSILNMATPIRMTSPQVKMNALVDKDHSTSVSGGFRFYRDAETEAMTASRADFEKISLNATALTGLTYATDELLRFSPESFVSVIQAGFGREYTGTITNEMLNGTGVGEFMGILSSPAKISVSAEDGQAADTILFENVLKMRARCYEYNNAVWLANHDTLPQLAVMKLDIGTGGSAMFIQSAVPDVPSTLFGRPIYFMEHCQTLGDEGDIILVNWRDYLKGTLMPMTGLESSIHVRFENRENCFRIFEYNAGAPWWRSAMTPVNSSDTLSPYVTLAERT